MNYDFGNLTKDYLDIMFYSKWSERPTSQLIETFDFEESGKLNEESLVTIAAILVELFTPKWDKLKNLHQLEYDPIHNYLDKWEDHSDGVSSLDGKNDRSDNFTDLQTNDLKSDRTYSSSNNDDTSISAFNSGGKVPTDYETGGENGTESNTNEGTVTTNRTGSRSDTIEENSTNKIDRHGQHEGNIGNITTQQLIREEIKTWEWNFMEQVLDDVKSQLTNPMYF